MPTYPMIRALVLHGGKAAVVLGVATLLLGVVAAIQGANALYAVAGLLAGAVFYVLFKSYVELVTIIADMMLPK